MFRMTLALLSLVTISNAYAAEPPAHCAHGAVWYTGTLEGEGCDFAAGECQDVDYGFDFDFLDTSVRRHALVNELVQVKGDGALGFSANDDVAFYDSISGYIGTDESNLEGNAYLTYQIGTTADRGPAWVWTTKNNGSWCSKEFVYLQNRPDLDIDIHTTPEYRSDGTVLNTFVQLTADAYVDRYSKVGVQNANYAIDWYTRYSLSVDWDHVASNTDSFSRTYYNGVVYFKVVLSDGTYKDVKTFHLTTAEPASDADPCIKKPWMPMCDPLSP